jgi:hypothetical protein
MSDFHTAFAAALQGGADDGLLPHLAVRAGAADRLAVYRNNVARAAMEALGRAYPAVKRLVGEEFFNAMARAFQTQHPPRARTLLLYGEGFDSFIASFRPAATMPYLADIARLDRAWLEAHHAPDSLPLNRTALRSRRRPDLGALRPRLRHSVRLLASPYPAHDIWRTNREDEQVQKIRLDSGPQAALIHRPDDDVRHRAITGAEHAFLEAIAGGASVCEAAQAAAFPTVGDVSSAFIDLMDEGIFIGGEKDETA